MNNLVLLLKRALQTSAIAMSVATAFTGCGGDSGSAVGSAVTRDAVTRAAVTRTQIVPPNATFEGQTYAEWETAFWQWALALPLAPLPHPFNECNYYERPISAGQTGDVWFWSAPDAIATCDQSAVVIPAGKAIFLTTLYVEASSLDAAPFFATTAAGQLAIAQQFANYIQNLFVTIDGVPVDNVTAYRTTTGQFQFTAPKPWIFNQVGGNGTAVGDGYFLMLQLPPGPHTIHYGGKIDIPAGVVAHKPVTVTQDITLFVTMGR